MATSYKNQLCEGYTYSSGSSVTYLWTVSNSSNVTRTGLNIYGPSGSACIVIVTYGSNGAMSYEKITSTGITKTKTFWLYNNYRHFEIRWYNTTNITNYSNYLGYIYFHRQSSVADTTYSLSFKINSFNYISEVILVQGGTPRYFNDVYPPIAKNNDVYTSTNDLDEPNKICIYKTGVLVDGNTYNGVPMTKDDLYWLFFLNPITSQSYSNNKAVRWADISSVEVHSS